MKPFVYLPCALIVALAAVTGSDLFARMTIAGTTATEAWAEHLRWLMESPGVALLLFASFIVIGLTCDGVKRYAPGWQALALFSVASAVLGYVCFNAFQAVWQAYAEQRWTAAALSLAFPAMFIGVPLAVVTGIAGIVLAMTGDRRAREA